MLSTPLIPKHASANRPSWQWNDDDFDVLANSEVVGRIFKANAAPVGSSWIWALAFGHHEDRTPTHGYEPTREEAMQAKSWHRVSEDQLGGAEWPAATHRLRNNHTDRVFKHAGLLARTAMINIRIAFSVLASITLAVDVQPAAAEIYRPWCVQYGGNDGDNGTTCAFTSFEQCMMTARGGGFCVQNPWYLAYGSGQKRAESAGRSGQAKRR